MLQHQYNSLLNKSMNRRDFLVHIGCGIIMLTGLGALLKGLNNLPTYHNTIASHPTLEQPKATHGFGAKGFGT